MSEEKVLPGSHVLWGGKVYRRDDACWEAPDSVKTDASETQRLDDLHRYLHDPAMKDATGVLRHRAEMAAASNRLAATRDSLRAQLKEIESLLDNVELAIDALSRLQ